MDRYAGAERVISGGSGCHSGVPISAYRAPPKAYLSVPLALRTMVNQGEAAEEYVPVFPSAVPAVIHYSSDHPARFVSLGWHNETGCPVLTIWRVGEIPGRRPACRAREASVFHRAVQSRGRMGQYFGIKTQYIVFLSASMR